MRIAPDMDGDEIAELTTAKFWLNWAKPRYEWAFTGSTGQPPQLPKLDGDDALALVMATPGEATGARPSDPLVADDGSLTAVAQSR
jgi:hypothetical protein